MSAETFTPVVGVSMTARAASHVRKQLAKNPAAQGIRLAVKQSGCSGFKYVTEWVTDVEDNDKVFSVDDVQIFVRNKDLPYVNGTEIDFVTEGVNSLFYFRNPNATAECGCGESFSIV